MFDHSISVIIPTYGRPSDVKELLWSIKEQSVKPKEIIVVDDTPNDSVKQVCDGEVTYIRNHRVASATVARNLGAEKAASSFLLFLDSDVVLDTQYLQKILDVFRVKPWAVGAMGHITNHPSFNEKYNLFAKIIGSGYGTRNSCPFWGYPVFLDYIVEAEWLSGSNMMVRRDIFMEVKFDESPVMTGYTYMEDKLFSKTLKKRCMFYQFYITPHAKLVHKVSEEGNRYPRHMTDCMFHCFRLMYPRSWLLRIWRMKFGHTLYRILKYCF